MVKEERNQMRHMNMHYLILILLVFPLSAQDDDSWRVNQVTFIGNEALRRNELLELMQMRPSRLFSRVTYSFSALIDDIAVLEAYYRNRGYLDVNISIAEIERDTANQNVNITLRIEEGLQTIIESIVFTGNHVFSDAELMDIIELAVGEPLDSAAFASAAEVITDSLAGRGYLFANVYRSLRLDTLSTTAIVMYEIEEGSVVSAGTFEFQGLEKVHSEVIRRELRFEEGDQLTRELIRESIRRIYTTGLFTFVRIEPLDTIILEEPDSAIVPVVIQVQEGDMFQIQGGGGYESDDGWYLTLQASYRNLFSLGHRITGSVRVASDVIGGRLAYNYPWFLSLPVFADLTTYLDRRDEESFEGVFSGGLAAISGRLGQYNSYRTWTRFEHVNWIVEPPPGEYLPDVPTRNTFSLGLGLTRDTRANIFYPGTSIFSYLEGEIAGLGFSWSSNFYRFRFDVRGYYAFGQNRFSLSSALFTGYVNGFGDDRNVVPAQELFRSGENAVRPVRGYDQEETTPLDDDGNVLGGTFALILNVVEFRFPIWAWFSGAVFVDAGEVWPNLDQVNIDNLRWSAGPGIRLILPFLLARLDYGIKLDGDWDLDGRFHLSIGLPF